VKLVDLAVVGCLAGWSDLDPRVTPSASGQSVLTADLGALLCEMGSCFGPPNDIEFSGEKEERSDGRRVRCTEVLGATPVGN